MLFSPYGFLYGFVRSHAGSRRSTVPRDLLVGIANEGLARIDSSRCRVPRTLTVLLLVGAVAAPYPTRAAVEGVC